jgi:hypothetical protein
MCANPAILQNSRTRQPSRSLPPSLPAVPNKCHLARKKRIRVWLPSPVWKPSTYVNPRLSFCH